MPLLEHIHAGVRVDYDIYTPEAVTANPEKGGTKLFYMPGQPGRPFVMICPGGAYAAICSLKEGFTVGRRFNELGYTAFILSYQVCSFGSPVREQGLFPRPLEDLAAALRLIRENRDLFGMGLDGYALADFSAGGHLAGLWAGVPMGAARYGLPRPAAVFLGYSALDTSLYPTFGGKNIVMEVMLGQNYRAEDARNIDVVSHIDEAYPAAYIFHCADDGIVTVETSRRMARELESRGIPCRYREAAHGGHGFGLGDSGEVSGWANEAAELWEQTNH